jgi:hypothetical protein
VPTLREMAEKAHDLEQRILVYNWLELQLRTLVDGKNELRIDNKPVEREIVDAVMADVLDHRELAQQELKTFWEQPVTIGTGKSKKEELHEPPSLETPPEPGNAQPRRKR